MVRGYRVMSAKSTSGFDFVKRLTGTVAGLAVATALAATSAQADYADGEQAFNLGEFTKAEDLWIRYGSAGDIRSKLALADLYAGSQPLRSTCSEFGSARLPKEDEKALRARISARADAEGSSEDNIIPTNAEEALAWYMLAAYHDFYSYSQNPTQEEYQAKIVAQQCVITLQSELGDNEVIAAQERVEQILSGGTDYDLYRLAMMYKAGAGMPKDNIKALQYLMVADNNKAFGSAVGNDDMVKLKATMPDMDRELAADLAANWQPPLPVAYSGKTPREIALEEREEQIRNRELKLELANIEKEFSKNEDLLQSALAALGFYRGPIDGDVGQKTRNAVRAFQFAISSEDRDLTDEQIRNRVTGALSHAQKVELIERAADRDHPQSMYVFGIMNARGIGIPVDGDRAVKWWEESAGYGYALSHFALGQAYHYGIDGKNPIEPNLTQATYYYGQAVALGYTQAADELKKLRYEPSPADNQTGSLK